MYDEMVERPTHRDRDIASVVYMDRILEPGDLPRAPFLERISTRQWTMVDGILAVLFFAGSTTALFATTGTGHPDALSKWLELPFYAAGTLPVAFRRRWPEIALLSIIGAMTVMTMRGQPLPTAPVLALPLYTVILKYSRRQSLVVLAVVEALSLIAFAVSATLRPVTGDVTFTFVLAVATWFAGDSVRTRRAYQKGLVEQATERQRQELDRAQRAVVEERLDIARELHDVIAHSLSVIAVQSGVGRHVIDNQPDEARAALSAIEETSRSALNDLRRVLGVLRHRDHGGPELAPAPALSDLDDLVERVRGAGVPIELQFSGVGRSLPPGLELSVYRIVQEALTNVVKHARSAHTWVCLQQEPEELVVSVTNAPLGAGSEISDAGGHPFQSEHRDRHGIIGMTERAAAFGGSLTANVLPDGGFQVLARLPTRQPL
jgi:signal transduction histidine kinase